MPPKSPQPELSRTCAHPACCSHEAAEAGATFGHPAGTLPDRPEPQGGGRWGSFKRYALCFLAFFGIYASSSVCVFCGTPGCPVGAGAAALVGGVFACLWQYGKMILIRLRGLFATLHRKDQA
jgi:hypothetical protein